MRNFDYLKARSLQDAVELLTKYGEKAHILAGGTDVLVKMKQREIAPEVLIDITGIPDLGGIEYRDGEGMRIGPLTTIREIEISPVIHAHLPALAHAAHVLGSVQIRNRATIGGNLCNALPSADMAPSLIGMRATATLLGPVGERIIPVEELFAGSARNSLGRGEVLKSIDIPAWSRYTGIGYIKHAIKNAVDVAIVSVAAVVVVNLKKKIFEEARIVLGAVGPTPIRAKEAEEFLRGKGIEDSAMDRAGELASKDARPRTTVEYKTQMVKVFTKRALKQALEKIPKG